MTLIITVNPSRGVKAVFTEKFIGLLGALLCGRQ